ncbi:pyridoxal phosphate-dependent transferase [Naematelia encephala]|uniref:Pyridoxal phosphate-dependent transferase n=1 Tax=Naematelia encephala TaxID=71784 RepID=A0A1Y2B4T0_9TREE|nr:pyridoxal phosphate-dependent transferase [Naematelia encephala]
MGTASLNFAIAPAVDDTEAPPIPKARAWAETYLSSSLSSSSPLLDLSQGVPRSAPHPEVLSSLSSISASPSAARYGPILGEPELRSSVATEIQNQYLTSNVLSEDIAITAGCNMAFLVLLMVVCPPKTSIMLPLPAYFNQSMCASLQSLNVVYIPAVPDKGFTASIESARISLEKDKKQVSSGTGLPGGQGGDGREGTGRVGEGNGQGKIRMIVLVSPSNPTGTIYNHQQLKEWYDLAKEFKVALVLDETYRDFVQGPNGNGIGQPHTLFDEPDWRGTLVCVGSFSKGYRIPGHRLGSIIASPVLLKRITTVCDCMQICAPRPPQLALAPLLAKLRSDLLESSAQLSHRRRLFSETVNSVPGWSVDSIGGYFAYVSFPAAYLHASSVLGLKRKQLGSEDVARVLATRVGVVTLPGAFFMPPLNADDVWEEIVDGDMLRQDRWLRFAVANVEDDVVLQLGPRLKQMNELMGMDD